MLTMIQFFKRITPICCVLLAAWIGSAQALPAQQVSVSTRFEPALIHADAHAFYVLTINGTQRGVSGDMPELDGLQVLGPQQTGSSVSIINGVTTVQLSIRIPMGAEAPGQYTVPAFTIEVNGQSYLAPEAQLRVLPVDEAAQAAAAAGSPVKLQMQLPQGPYYVGQAIPVTLSLNSDPRVSLSGGAPPVKFGSDNYMLSPFAELGSRRTEAGGEIVNQYRMGTVVTPLTSGDVSLGFEQTVVAYIPPHLRNGQANRALANDPFSQLFGRDSLFDRMTNREELKLKTQSQSLKIDSLPAQGRPQGFSGAIGQFTLGEPTLSANEVKVGEPVTISFSVSGAGNFDRMQPPALADSGTWRSYTPQSRFQPQDPVGYSGTKTFEYTLIARNQSATQTPQIDFSYFDPESGAYVDLPIPPLPITVTPGADNAGALATRTPAAAATTTASGNDLLPLMPSLGQPSGSLTLLIGSPVFYSVQALPALALAGFVLYRRHRLRLENDPRFARRHFARRRIRAALAAARTSAAQGNATAFYHSAAAALQELLSIDEPQIAAASLTSGELEVRLREIGANAEDISLARLFLHESDALQYGTATSTAPLTQRQQELEQLVHKLEKAATAKPVTRNAR